MDSDVKLCRLGRIQRVFQIIQLIRFWVSILILRPKTLPMVMNVVKQVADDTNCQNDPNRRKENAFDVTFDRPGIHRIDQLRVRYFKL